MTQQPPGSGEPVDPHTEATVPSPWSPTVPLPQQPTTQLPQASSPGAGAAPGWANVGPEATWTGDETAIAEPPPGPPAWASGGYAPQQGAGSPQYPGATQPAYPPPSAPAGYSAGYPTAPSGYPAGAAAPYPGAGGQAPYAAPPSPGAPAAYQQPGSAWAYQPTGSAGAMGPTAYQPTGPGGAPGPWQPPGAPPKKTGSKLPLLIVGGVAAIAVVVGGVVLVPKLLSGNTPGTTGGSGATTSVAPAPKASDAVQAYLQALSKGDAAAALALLDAPGDKTLLTSEALKAGAAKGAVSGISVTPDSSDNPTSVTAKYTVGAESTSYDFPVVKRDGAWKVLKGTNKLLVRGSAQGNAPIKLNGIAISATAPSELPAFPGAYTYASANPALTLTGDVTAIVINPVSAKGPPTLPWALADPAAVLNAAKATVAPCVAAKTLLPPNCPFGLTLRTSQVISDPNTIVWTLKNDPWAGVTPAVNPANPQVVTIKIVPQLRSEARVTENGRTFNGFLDLTYDSTAEVDVSGATPKVTWDYTKKA